MALLEPEPGSLTFETAEGGRVGFVTVQLETPHASSLLFRDWPLGKLVHKVSPECPAGM